MSPTHDLTRRRLLGGALPIVALALGAPARSADRFAGSPFRALSDSAWRARLPAASFEVLRREGTERPFTSPLLNEHRRGRFVCLACGLPLFESGWKYDSGTGWPSFWRAIPGALGTKADFAIGVERTEYHCAQCLGHQGHVFDDGPRPTGLRYCNNGVALRFEAA
ncbi:MAG: peptide-methionine (R)-S-oxide reductase MsrB [Alphaproteobacteria bacterium]|nr:peptide-methionine (R)-S-oxide reductase MsrB [Alphaproteobacteria bacterium]